MTKRELEANDKQLGSQQNKLLGARDKPTQYEEIRMLEARDKQAPSQQNKMLGARDKQATSQ